MLRSRKYRFALCFRVPSNQFVERSAYANVFKFNREKKRFERAKVNSRCFHSCVHWFPAAMLESLRGVPTWRLHTKHYNFQWHPLPNNSSSDYRTSPKLWYVGYLRYGNTGNIFLQLVLQHCCIASWNPLLRVLPRLWPTCLATKYNVASWGNMLHKVESSSTFCNKF